MGTSASLNKMRTDNNNNKEKSLVDLYTQMSHMKNTRSNKKKH